MISLDITKVYDTVWKQMVLSILQKWNLKVNILTFIHKFLTGRNFEVKVKYTLSSTFETENGLPQGYSLSLTIFFISINDISKYITLPVKTILYAENCNLY
jgi:hypothetical protein